MVKNMVAISFANYEYFGLIFAFTVLHTSEISQGTEYEYELFVSQKSTFFSEMPEIRLLFTHVISDLLLQVSSIFPIFSVFCQKKNRLDRFFF